MKAHKYYLDINKNGTKCRNTIHYREIQNIVLYLLRHLLGELTPKLHISVDIKCPICTLTNNLFIYEIDKYIIDSIYIHGVSDHNIIPPLRFVQFLYDRFKNYSILTKGELVLLETFLE